MTSDAVEEIAQEYAHLDIGTDNTDTIYKKFERLGNFTVSLIRDREYAGLLRILRQMEKINTSCEIKVRNAIENIFVYKIGMRLEAEDGRTRRKFVSMLPCELSKMMFKQLNSSGL